ncbi:MAG: hypothetical protein IPJ60_19145 [Sphingobacteriaceae bacterium]|nr:hypothetical protein [Sphingobacteriaceae bacterium]
MLIPMYFIIGIWGGEQRIYASVKFFLYTMFGSLLMLISIIWLAVNSVSVLGHFSTDLIELYSVAPSFEQTLQMWMFFAFALVSQSKYRCFRFTPGFLMLAVQAPTAV